MSVRNSKIFDHTIDMEWDNYYINPYRFDKLNDPKNPTLISTNRLVNLINNFTDKSIDKNNSNSTNDNDKPFNPLLFKLIANDNMSQLEAILDKNLKKNLKQIDVNEQDKDGDTPLHISVFLSNIIAIKLLFKYGADFYIKDKWGQTPLHRICFSMGENKSGEIIDIFIENNKSNKNTKNNKTYKINKNSKVDKISNKEDILNIFDIQDNYGNTVCHLVLKHIIKNKTTLNQNHKTIVNKIYEQTNKSIKNIDGHNIEDLIKNVNIN